MTASTVRAARLFSTATADFVVDNLVVGGGVVGLAIAAQLASIKGTSTILVERNHRLGEETSSRNSQVIHSGIYYPKDSLKTRFCIRGKEMLYDVCQRHGISHDRVGKWIVAQTDDEMKYLQSLHSKASTLGVETSFLDPDEAKSIEPAVRAEAGVLVSPTTGIVDVHELMSYLEGTIEEASDADIALETTVNGIEPLDTGFMVQTTSSGVQSSIYAKKLINAAGLAAPTIFNLLEKKDTPTYKYHYCKGSYWTHYPTPPHVKHLIYPCPEKGLAGLGTHLTLDLQGRPRFGPDVQFVESDGSHFDYQPSSDKEHLEKVAKAVAAYLPGITAEGLTPDYAGIRPKLSGPGEPAQDFIVEESEEYKGLINCIGIESPGLTSSLAIAEHVKQLLD